jgi:hypothetical protein
MYDDMGLEFLNGIENLTNEELVKKYGSIFVGRKTKNKLKIELLKRIQEFCDGCIWLSCDEY